VHPILFQIGSYPVHTFGFCMGSGFLVGILYSIRQARIWGVDPDKIFNTCFWVMVSGVLGSRLMYIGIDLAYKRGQSEFMTLNPIKILALWEGGLVWYGGMILASIVALSYARAVRLPVWTTADILAPATFMGLAIGRVGCLMAGDDFGKPTTVPWAIVFHNPEALVYPPSLIGQPLHPTQVYMEAKSFFVAFVGHLLLRRKRFDGQVMGVSFMIYAVLRYIVEIYRGDSDRGWIPWTHQTLSTSQGVGIAVFAVGLLILGSRRRAMPAINLDRPPPPPPPAPLVPPEAPPAPPEAEPGMPAPAV